MKFGTPALRTVISVSRELYARARERFYRITVGQRDERCPSLPCISFGGDFSACPIGVLVKQCFDRALTNVHNLPNSIRRIDGMSGQKYRSFINNLVGSHPDPRYLVVIFRQMIP